jgi:hypothetical protein
MKPLTLTNAEAAHLAAHDELVVVREVKPQPEPEPARFQYLKYDGGMDTAWAGWCPTSNSGKIAIFEPSIYGCPLGAPGQRLWCRETWADVLDCGHYNHLHGTGVSVLYKADGHTCPDRWRSPVTMPRWASRWTVVVEDVQVKQVAGESNPEQVWCWVVKVRKEG